MALSIVFEDVDDFSFSEELLMTSYGRISFDFSKILGDVSLVFCSDAYILDVNMKYLNHDYFTDIITFDYSADSVVSGDLIVSLETVLSNSVIYNTQFNVELFRVAIHGILHLCGLDDKTDDDLQKMRVAENKYLNFCANPFA